VARLRFVRPEVRDVRHIVRHLRQHDVQELQAVHGPDLDLQDCLRTAVLASEECHVLATTDGEPVALFGLAPVSLLGGMACPWLLGTDAFMAHPRDIVVLGKRMVLQWSTRYDLLFNYVDARNLRSIAWLQHIGFQVFEPQPYGLAGLPFHRFERCT
jgi:hypothetical protein